MACGYDITNVIYTRTCMRIGRRRQAISHIKRHVAMCPPVSSLLASARGDLAKTVFSTVANQFEECSRAMATRMDHGLNRIVDINHRYERVPMQACALNYFLRYLNCARNGDGASSATLGRTLPRKTPVYAPFATTARHVRCSHRVRTVVVCATRAHARFVESFCI